MRRLVCLNGKLQNDLETTGLTIISKYERAKSVPPIEVVLAYSRLANVTMNQIVDDDVDLPL